MEFHQREYFISRIILSSVRLKIKGLTVVVHPLTIEQNYEAQEIFQEAYQEAFLAGVMVSKEIEEMMIEQKMWSAQHDGDVKKLNDKLEDLKVEIYKAQFDTKQQRRIRKGISGIENALDEYYKRKHIYDSTSCIGIASYARWCWIIEYCTTENSLPYDFKRIGISEILSKYQDELLDEKQLRLLSRTEPWRGIWSSGKKVGNLFSHPAVEYTQEQKTLILWSAMYDSIAESPDCPPDDVLSDDDMTDGWLILQRRERESAQNQKQLEDTVTNEKIANAQEVFIVAKSAEDVERIELLNSEEAKKIKTLRKEIVNADEQTGHKDMPDIKTELQMMANRAYIQKMKSGK